MDNIQSQYQQMVSHLSQAVTNEGLLPRFEPHFTALLNILPYPRVRKIFRSETSDIIREFREQVSAIQTDLEAKSSEIEKSLAASKELNEIQESELKSLAAEIEGLRRQVASQLDVWGNTQEAAITERIAELNEIFEASQQKRREEHQTQIDRTTKAIDRIRDDAVKLEATIRKELAKTENVLSDWRMSEVEEAEKILKKIKEIYEIVGQTTLAGDFEKAAKEETSTAWWYSLAAGIFFVVAPMFFAYQWWSIELTDYDPSALIAKLGSSAIFLVPAAYFATTAQRHRRVATALRSLGVRVATFDAYLANFDDTEKNEMKTQMARVFFAAEISPDRIRNASTKELNTIASGLSSLTEQVSKLIIRDS